MKDSESVVRFGRRKLTNPARKKGIAVRYFDDIKPDVFLKRKDEVQDKVKTLAGISTKYQYVCEVKVSYNLTN